MCHSKWHFRLRHKLRKFLTNYFNFKIIRIIRIIRIIQIIQIIPFPLQIPLQILPQILPPYYINPIYNQLFIYFLFILE